MRGTVHGIGVPQKVCESDNIFGQLGRWHVGGKVHNNGDRAEGTDGSVSPRHVSTRVRQLSASVRSNTISINNIQGAIGGKDPTCNMRGGLHA